MGLDMYLNGRIQVSKYNDTDLKQDLETTLQKHNLGAYDAFAKCANLQTMKIVFEVGYWRKANAIHAWFVKNVQKGIDDCGEYYVSKTSLKNLKEECEAALETRDSSKLEPQEGFFFGSTEKNDWYWDSLSQTVEIISRCLDITGDVDFYYRSSW